MIQWAHDLKRLWPGKREGVTRVWVKAKMAVYMLLEWSGAPLKLQMGSADGLVL